VNGHWPLWLDAVESEYLRPLLRLARNEYCKCLRGVSEDDNTRRTVDLSARRRGSRGSTSTATSLHGSFAPDDLSLLHVGSGVVRTTFAHVEFTGVTQCGQWWDGFRSNPRAPSYRRRDRGDQNGDGRQAPRPCSGRPASRLHSSQTPPVDA